MSEQIRKLIRFTASNGLVFVLIFGASILVRLPHFLSDDFFFDGDEGIIGIMAQDFINGYGLPVFFYGQNYGFSSLEVISTAFFIKLIGTSIWALRLGGLFLFSIGVFYIWKVFELKKIKLIYSLLTIFILIASPTWFLWGSMVRGGYVTSFLAVSMLFYITQLKPTSWKWAFLSGLIFVIAYAGQPLISLVAFPFIIQWFWPLRDNLKKVVGFVGITAILLVFLQLFESDEAVWTAPKTVFFSLDQFQNLATQLEGFLFGYSNFFFFTMNLEIPVWWLFLLILSLGLILISIIYFHRKGSDSHKRVLRLMFICLLINLFLISSVSLYSPRYWLGFFTALLFLFLLSILYIEDSTRRKSILVLIALIYSIGIFASKDMKRDWYFVDKNEMKMISGLYNELKKKEIRAVFITDPVVQWKWNYLFGRKIPGTFFSDKERTNTFRNAVFKQLKKDQSQVAIIGLFGNYVGLDEKASFKSKIQQVETKYYIVEEVNRELVQETIQRLR